MIKIYEVTNCGSIGQHKRSSMDVICQDNSSYKLLKKKLKDNDMLEKNGESKILTHCPSCKKPTNKCTCALPNLGEGSNGMIKIIESDGYKVNKNDPYIADDEDIANSLDYFKDQMCSISELLSNYGGIDLFREERGSSSELDIPCKMLEGDYNNIYVISDEDSEGDEILEIFHNFDSKELKKVKLPNNEGYCILVEVPGMGRFVYQNQWGLESIFKKF